MMKRFWTSFRRNYVAEAITALVVISILLAMGLALYLGVIPPQLATSVSVLVTALVFVSGTVYGRHKDRREAKRSRALSMFMEWHSPDMRASRIFASHYLNVRAGGDAESLPSLHQVEIAAAKEYGNNTPNKVSEKGSKYAELYDATQAEFHFFRIYEFFERWSLLLANGDIAGPDSRTYLSSYGNWYLENFIAPWARKESERLQAGAKDGDQYLAASLDSIMRSLSPLGLSRAGLVKTSHPP